MPLCGRRRVQPTGKAAFCGFFRFKRKRVIRMRDDRIRSDMADGRKEERIATKRLWLVPRDGGGTVRRDAGAGDRGAQGTV